MSARSRFARHATLLALVFLMWPLLQARESPLAPVLAGSWLAVVARSLKLAKQAPVQ